jgi:hypothetical protein
VGDHEIEKAGAADFRQAVIAGHQEVGGQRHHLPGHHEGIGIVGQQHRRHAGQEQVVPEPEQGQGAGFQVPEIAPGIQPHPERRAAQQGQKEAGERVQAQVERQVRQADRQHDARSWLDHAGHAHSSHEQGTQRAQRKDQAARVAREQGRASQRKPVQHASPGQRDEIGCGQGDGWDQGVGLKGSRIDSIDNLERTQC